MSNLPGIKRVLEFLAPSIAEAYENSPALPAGQKGRSPSPVLPIGAEALVEWAKESPENKQAYLELREADRKYKAHLDVLMGNSIDDDGLLETEGVELKKAKYALEQEVNKFIDPDLKARYQAAVDALKPIAKEMKEAEREANKNSEVIRLTNLVEKMKSENTEATNLASVCQLASHLVESFRSNKEPKLERGQPWTTVFKAYGLEDPTKNAPPSEEDDNVVEG